MKLVMIQIHIPKQFATNVSLMRITPTWISNGHWCLKRELVRNLVDLRGYPDIEWREYDDDSVIEGFLAKTNQAEHEYTFTGLAKARSDGMSDLLKYEDADDNPHWKSATWSKVVYLDRDYINMARARGKGIDTSKLFSRNGETFYSECRRFIVMGVRQ